MHAPDHPDAHHAADAGDRDDRPWRPASSGPSFVYVIPCLGEDLLKLGMSRDPLDRIRTLHPRWFDAFDLDAGWLLQTDSVREARAIEARLGRALHEHKAPAPLTVPASAGGHTEWFRGAQGALDDAVEALRAQGFVVHAPLRPWLRAALEQRSSLLFHWTSELFEGIDADALPLSRWPTPVERTLRDALDAQVALTLPPDDLVPARVLQWWRALRRAEERS